MQPGAPSFSASANIGTRKFVKISGDYLVAQCVANDVAFGVSQTGAKDTPVPGAGTLAAAAGDPVRVFGQGECAPMAAGAALTAGQFVKPDANGDPIPAVATDKYSGQVLHAQATVGGAVEVFICRGVV
jgi:hypothetical protein